MDSTVITVLLLAVGLGVAAVSIVIHEGAHALVALMMGLRVSAVHIFAKRPRVEVVLKGRALPARAAAMLLAGPAANAATAVAIAVTLGLHLSVAGLFSMLAATTALMIGVINLVPVRRGVSATDGYKAVQWIFRPQLCTAQASVDPGQLARIVASTTQPLVLFVAVRRRLILDGQGYREFASDCERLLAIAQDPATKRTTAAAIAEWLIAVFGPNYLAMAITGSPVDRATREELIETAELAVRLAPQSDTARIGLAIARLIDGRPAQARELLASFPSRTSKQHVVVTQLFAIALIYLGERARADEVLAAVPPGEAMLGPLIDQLRASAQLPPLRGSDGDPAVVEAGQGRTA